MKKTLNHILYGFHLLFGRFDIYIAKKPSVLAHNLFDLVLMNYIMSLCLTIKLLSGNTILSFLFDNKIIFLAIVFVLTCLSEYLIYKKDNVGEKWFNEFELNSSKSKLKWELIAIILLIGSIFLLCITIEFWNSTKVL